MLKNKIKQTVQFFIFLLIGASVFYWLYKDQDWTELRIILTNDVAFGWIWLSLLLGLFSHGARALRWRMLIKASGSTVKRTNAFMAVLVGYLANLVLPRMGEVTRCGVLSKYNNVSFVTLAGTVLAERLTDFLFLILIVFVAMAIEFDMLWGFINDKITLGWVLNLFTSVWWWLLLASLVILVWFIMRRVVQMALFRRIKSLWTKFMDGFGSLKKMESKSTYLSYSIFIWLMYFMMQYVCFFAMDETSSLTMKAGLVLLVTGSIGMLAPVQGGVGAWHGMVIATLALYGVTHEPAYAFALLVHGAQNLMIVVIGLVSLVLFPVLNPHLDKQGETRT